jgi:short-subunit dehydrogenase
MSKKIALVTGASKGIGLAICRQLLQENWEVVGISRKFSQIESEFFTPYPLDLEDLKNLPKELKILKEKYPVPDAIVCSAGKGHFGSLEELSFATLKSVMDLNFLSHVYLLKTFIPSMKQRERGDVILIGSEAALQGKRMGSIYCASKFALRGFAQALREECATSDIRISLINPGMVRTGFFDSLSFAPGEEPSESILPEDVADAVSLVVNTRQGTVFDEINLSPQRKRIQFKAPQRFHVSKPEKQDLQDSFQIER